MTKIDNIKKQFVKWKKDYFLYLTSLTLSTFLLALIIWSICNLVFKHDIAFNILFLVCCALSLILIAYLYLKKYFKTKHHQNNEALNPSETWTSTNDNKANTNSNNHTATLSQAEIKQQTKIVSFPNSIA